MKLIKSFFSTHPKAEYIFFFINKYICIAKEALKKRLKELQQRNTHPLYKRTQDTRKAQKTLSLNAYTPILLNLLRSKEHLLSTIWFPTIVNAQKKFSAIEWTAHRPQKQ